MNIKKFLHISFLITGLLLLIVGCAEDESPVTPEGQPLLLSLISPTGEIPYHGTATYSWSTRGGAGTYTYRYTFGSNPEVTNYTNSKVTYTMLENGSYTFSVTVTDKDNKTASVQSGTLTVAEFDSSTIVQPTLAFILSPEAGRDVAENAPLTFSWEGADASVNGGIKGFEYKLENVTTSTVVSQTDTITQETTISFAALTAGDYYFSVTAINEYDLTISDSVAFAVKPAYILWMDDHDLGTDAAEFIERKNDWGAALSGFAWEEFDVNDNYVGSTATCDIMEALVNGSTFETIIWDEGGTDDNYLLWYSTNGIGARAPWLIDYLENGGNLIMIGSNMMGQIVDDSGAPPADSSYEDFYMGMIPDSVMDVINMTIDEDSAWVNGIWSAVYDTTYDTTNVWPYADDAVYMAYGGYTTLSGNNGYTDISIDVAKDGDTHQNGIAFYLLKPGIKTIFSDADGDPVGYVYDPPGTSGKIAVLGMNLYFSPAAEIRSVIQKILIDEFGH